MLCLIGKVCQWQIGDVVEVFTRGVSNYKRRGTITKIRKSVHDDPICTVLWDVCKPPEDEHSWDEEFSHQYYWGYLNRVVIRDKELGLRGMIPHKKTSRRKIWMVE